MKRVESLKILGRPATTGRKLPCPSGHCDFKSHVNEDGSVLCPEHGFFEPESTVESDAELMQMRRNFDNGNGITVSDRVLGPGSTAFVNR